MARRICMPGILYPLKSVLASMCVLAMALSALSDVAMAANPVPLINQLLVPDAGAPGEKALSLTVHGTGFVPGSVVHWNGSARATTFISNSTLKASILATDVASSNTASVTAVNPAPGGGTSNVAFFEITKSTSWPGLGIPKEFSLGFGYGVEPDSTRHDPHVSLRRMS